MKHLFKRFLIFGFSSIIILLFLSHNSFAESYKVKKGDSLYKISKKYKISIDDIKEINNLESNSLKVGSTINLPSKKSLITSKNKTTDKDNIETYMEHFPKILPYIVKKGDTLYGIAQGHNTTVKELKRLNKLKRSALKIGQKLVIPVEDEQSELSTYLRQEIEINTDSETTKGAAYNSEKDFELDSVDLDEKLQSNLESLDKKERLILFAKKFLNIPYRFGGSSLLGIDCSAFVQKVFDFLNIPLPRTAREQFYMGNNIDKDDLTIGDLVFFKTYASFPSHVGIYIGDNLFIHASSKDKKVKINNLDEPYYFKRFLGAKRLIEPKEAEASPETEEDKPR